MQRPGHVWANLTLELMIDWNVLAERFRGVYTATGKSWAPHVLRIDVDGVEFTVEEFTVSAHGAMAPINYDVFRIRAAYVSTDGFELELKKRGWLSSWLGGFRTGDPAFDEHFSVTTNDEAMAKRFFMAGAGYREQAAHGDALRGRLVDHPWFRFKVEGPTGWANDPRFVEEARQLRHEQRGKLPADTEDASMAIFICRLALRQLQAIGSATDGDPFRA